MMKPEPIRLFKTVFARLTPDSVMPLRALYSSDVEFEDPLHQIRGIEALEAYFARLNSKVISAEFVFGTAVVASGEAALTWTMTIQAKRARQTFVVPGVSVIRFAERITYQRDYFDVGAMVYERLPLLGWVLRCIKKMLG